MSRCEQRLKVVPSHLILCLKRPPDVAQTVTLICVPAVLCSLFCLSTVLQVLVADSSYPVHSKEDAWPSLRIAIVGVLQPRTVPQPGPLKLTRFPLGALLQVVLHEVSVLCTANILPLLSAIVIR